MVVGDRAQGAADAGALKEHRQHQDEEPGDDRRPQIELVDQDAAGNEPVEQNEGVFRDAEVEGVNLAAEHRLAKPGDEKGDADRRHEEDEPVLVDQRAQHQPLDRECEGQHDQGGGNEGQRRRHDFHQPDQRQCREQAHRALREVEHPRRLEDQHKAERHQRIEDARQEPADQHFEDEEDS